MVVNLYPFTETVAQPDCTLAEADRKHRHRRTDAAARRGQELPACGCGQPTRRTTAALLAEMESSGGAISRSTRFNLARKAFSHTAAYDSAISNYLTAHRCWTVSAEPFPGPAEPQLCQAAGSALRREPAPARGLLPRSAARSGRAVRTTFSFRARSCRTTTSPTPTRRGNASRPSISRPA